MIAENMLWLQMRSQEILINSSFKILIPKQQLLFSKIEILKITDNSDCVGLIIFDENLDLEDDLKRRNLQFIKFLEQNFTKENQKENFSYFRNKMAILNSHRNLCDQHMQTPYTIIINIKNTIYSNIFVICVKIFLNEWENEKELDNFSKLCIKQWNVAEEAVECFLILSSKSTNPPSDIVGRSIPELIMPPQIDFPKFEMKHKLS